MFLILYVPCISKESTIFFYKLNILFVVLYRTLRFPNPIYVALLISMLFQPSAAFLNCCCAIFRVSIPELQHYDFEIHLKIFTMLTYIKGNTGSRFYVTDELGMLLR